MSNTTGDSIKPGCVLSITIGKDTFILGSPDFCPAIFEDVEQISQVFAAGMEAIEENDPVCGAFAFISSKDPRIHEMTDLDELYEAKLLSDPVTLIGVTPKDGAEFGPILTLFKCAETAGNWHSTGKAFVMESTCSSCSSSDKFASSLENAMKSLKKTVEYSSPKLKENDLGLLASIPASETRH
jgi:hypothetical protein